ncbi:MAG: SAM-dependent chlorinase/fluorinase [Thermoleophilia bacterium]|nr:SAM-dependent chlorinase/fluorinase [Thermoleophilia bacterium]
MERYPLITFLSDYGRDDGYDSACEAVLASLSPATRVLHVSHGVDVGDIRDGATILSRVAPLGPPAVHLAVIDPGVGTSRRPVAVCAERGDVLVGPDNGLLMPALATLGGATTAWDLDPVRVRSQAGLPPGQLSHTFHGRDLFAPAAALLANGRPPALLGSAIDPSSLVRLPEPRLERDDGHIRAEVIEIDRFGNVALCLSLDQLPEGLRHLEVQVVDEPDVFWNLHVVTTFSDLQPGELGMLQDSWGHASLALNGASAAEVLGARLGGMVHLSLL